MFCVFLLFFHSVIVRNLAISSSDSCRNRRYFSLLVTAGPPRLERFQITIERFQSRGQHLCQFIGTKESIYMWKEFNSHRIFLIGTPTWPPFHCFRTPIWPPWRHVKTLYTMDQLRFQVNIYTIDGIIDGILLASSKLRYYDAHSWWNTHYRRSKT